MKAQVGLFLIIGLIVILGVFGIGLILTYNSLVKSEKAVEEAKAQIETVIQRRLDLIPNLVETVKGYAQHEREVLLKVTQARAKAQTLLGKISSKKSLSKEDFIALSASQSELTKTLKSLFALVENYPDLKASTNFLSLQDQLEGTENRIAVARQRYNYAVRIYNTKIKTFPGNIIAPMFGFGEKDYFKAKEEATEPVRVKF
ncbi:MAG: LemA family protein [Candidatus Omnitrophota bacterium]|nr:MAG: LemA family protein [Candidatus Omnitrophota bacterium]RKY82814.1 MAG: LemA family protein [candidate division KSB1 bacterium]HEC69574.1 LemA family protein [Candidatus Omnitrophota bacterium]